MKTHIDRPRLSVKQPPAELPEIQEPEVEEATLLLPVKGRTTKRAYMVFGEAGDVPSMIHATRAHAQREAMRLALLNPGSRFHVLASWRAYATAEA